MLTLAALARVAAATPAGPGVRAHSLPVRAGDEAAAPDADADADATSVPDRDATVTPIGGDPIAGETEPDAWLAGLPVYDSWLAEDDVADLLGVAFAPDELDALMQRRAGPRGRLAISLAYRRRDDRVRTTMETSRHVDELWLVATWSR